MNKAKLYIDVDDTFLNTEKYMRNVLKANGIRVKNGLTAYDYRDNPVAEDLMDMLFSDYSVIPKMDGAEESLKILQCDYDVVFTSSVFSEKERDAKEKYFKEMGKKLIVIPGQFDLSAFIAPCSNTLVVNDKSRVLDKSGVYPINTYCMWNPRTSEKNIYEYLKHGGTVVFDWYELCDQIMGTQFVSLPKKIG